MVSDVRVMHRLLYAGSTGGSGRDRPDRPRPRRRCASVESAPSIWRENSMEHFAGIDVSLELSSVCVVDAQGKIVRDAKVASEPESLVAFFGSLGFAVKRCGPLSCFDDDDAGCGT